MPDKVIFIAVRILEIMFFTGAIGCAVTVAVSWVQICSEAFSPDDEEEQSEIH
jgi:hypothetical protein